MIKSYKGIGFLILTIILFSLQTIYIKMISFSLDPFTQAVYRTLLSYITIIIALSIIGYKEINIKTFYPSFKKIIISTICVLGIFLATYTFSLGSFQSATYLTYSYPIFVIILGYFFLQEKITAQKILLVVLGIFGIIFIYGNNVGGSILGNVLAITNSFVLAMIVVCYRYYGIQKISQTIGIFFYGAIIALILGIISKTSIHLSAHEIIEIFLLSIIFSAGAHFFLILALRHLEASTVSIWDVIITPLLTILLSLILLQESFNILIFIPGVLIIMTSAVIFSIQIKKERPTKTKLR